MKESIKFAILLFLVASVCSVLVVVASEIANPILAKREEKATTAAINNLYEDIDGYEEISIANESAYLTLDNIYKVTLENGTIEYVFKVATPGRNGEIKYLVSVDLTGMLTNIYYIEQKETPGRGDKVIAEDFTNQFIGSTTEDLEIDTISGATISSKAMISSLEEVSKYFEKELKS